jgi:Ca2+-binding EF-hand superfamily protein
MTRIQTFAACAGLLAAAIVAAAADQKPDRPKKPKDGTKPSQVQRLFKQYDKNQDGFLDRSECPEKLQKRFDQLDRNQDGKLSTDELPKAAPRPADPPADPPPGPAPDLLFRLLDANNDGKLSKDELQKAAGLLERFDRNKDGLIDRAELAAPAPPGRRPGEIVTPPAKGERQTDKLEVGQPAPDFTLPDPTGQKQVRLSSFRGQKPVVLIFGSFT